ncbi:hypothetical protein TgHK011_003254 [Trichoderma gracile]|nr:hypothetical protein TgHK011_003254 [Trichoderma gracile]
MKVASKSNPQPTKHGKSGRLQLHMLALSLAIGPDWLLPPLVDSLSPDLSVARVPRLPLLLLLLLLTTFREGSIAALGQR